MANKPFTIQWLDTLRALAMLGVIIIHVSSPLVNMTYGKNMPYWWIGNIADSAVRFAVPLFLMLSGATLLGKKYNLSNYYKRRFSRVLIPFLFWLVIYWVYRWAMLSPKLQPHDIVSIQKWAVQIFLKEGVSKHFWYIYMILSLYIFVPFIGNGLQKLNLSVVSNLLLFWVLLTFACKSIPLNMYSWSGDYGTKLLGYLLHSGYLLLGYYLIKLPVYEGKIRLLAAVIFFITVAISATFTYIFSQKNQQLDLSIYSYLSINTIIQSIAIFVWIKDTSVKNKVLASISSTISNYSYGIYLVHIIVIGILFRNGIYWKFAHPLFSLPVLTLGITFCSFGIIYALRKIPYGKYISG
jgi:surface polysaccharide O-acyltransferase-like enzyme